MRISGGYYFQAEKGNTQHNHGQLRRPLGQRKVSKVGRERKLEQ